MRQAFLLLIFAFLISGCVSIKLGNSKTQELVDFSYDKPHPNFVELGLKNKGPHWQSEVTGNIMGVVGTCPSSDDNTFNDILNTINKPTTESLSYSDFVDSRPLKMWKIQGFKEGLDFTVIISQYEKKGCLISALLLGYSEKIQGEIKDYHLLLKSLRAH